MYCPHQVVTFDDRGVSDHPNHIATYHGVKSALSMLPRSANNVIGLKLISVNVFRKFSGVLEILSALCTAEYVAVAFGLITALRGMFIHRSQNVWYRQIFVCLSAFTYVNSFAPIT